MASYVVSMMNKHDLARYGEYSAQGFVSLEGLPFEGIVGENLNVLEGTAPGAAWW